MFLIESTYYDAILPPTTKNDFVIFMKQNLKKKRRLVLKFKNEDGTVSLKMSFWNSILRE